MQTLKGPAESGSGARHRVAPGIRATAARAARIRRRSMRRNGRDTPWRARARRGAQTRGLAPRFATDFRRTTVPVALADGTHAQRCALDVGEVATAAGTRSADRRSSRSSSTTAALDTPVPVRSHAGARRAARPSRRAARPRAAMRCARRRPTHPARAAHPPIDAVDRGRARRCRRRSRAPARARSPTTPTACCAQRRPRVDPPAAHRARAGCARALALVLRDAVPEERRAPWPTTRSGSARALGPARDLDVLVDETLPAVRATLRATARAARARRVRAPRAACATRHARPRARRVASPRYHAPACSAPARSRPAPLGAGRDAPRTRTRWRVPRRAFATPWLVRAPPQALARSRRALTHAERRGAARDPAWPPSGCATSPSSSRRRVSATGATRRRIARRWRACRTRSVRRSTRRSRCASRTRSKAPDRRDRAPAARPDVGGARRPRAHARAGAGARFATLSALLRPH